MWLIDENAKIFFKEYCLNPPRVPTRTFVNVIYIKVVLDILIITIMYKGIIFCTTAEKNKFFHLTVFMTLGNQENKGAAPNFIIILEIIMKLINKLGVKYNLIMQENRNVLDLIDWIKKYLIVDSVSWVDLQPLRMGTKAIRFISIENQIARKLLDDKLKEIVNSNI